MKDLTLPTPALLPCPFCGHDKPYFERMGTGSVSCQVACGNCGAWHESSDEYLQSGKSWNTRAALSSHHEDGGRADTNALKILATFALEANNDAIHPLLIAAEAGRALRRAGLSRLDDVVALGNCAAMGEVKGEAATQLLVDVFFLEGDEPFICAVHGKATVGVLEEIERDLVANDGDFYSKGDGIYRMECSRFPGQYGFEGRCEIAPGWEFDEVSFEPLVEPPEGGNRSRG